MAAYAGYFAYLHSAVKTGFGTDVKVWYPTTRGGNIYAVGIECASGPLSAKAVDAMGLNLMPTDGISIHATAAQFPFDPMAEDNFILGVTAATGTKYAVLSAARMAGSHSHWRIVAQRVS